MVVSEFFLPHLEIGVQRMTQRIFLETAIIKLYIYELVRIGYSSFSFKYTQTNDVSTFDGFDTKCKCEQEMIERWR